jgi:hypothetical protein
MRQTHKPICDECKLPFRGHPRCPICTMLTHGGCDCDQRIAERIKLYCTSCGETLGRMTDTEEQRLHRHMMRGNFCLKCSGLAERKDPETRRLAKLEYLRSYYEKNKQDFHDYYKKNYKSVCDSKNKASKN